MVLAIGIVVDDAIVVVENVERVMEEHPELTPAEATKQAMAEITAPIIAITLVLLSVFVPVAFIPGISGELFRQFAVTVAVVDVAVGHQRADAVAGAVRGAAEAASRAAPRADGLRHARRSTGSGTAMARSWRAWCASRSSASCSSPRRGRHRSCSPR